jgi:hypothetical protein
MDPSESTIVRNTFSVFLSVFAGTVVLTSTAYLMLPAIATAQTNSSTRSTGYLPGPFVLKNPTSLGPGFLGHDIRTVVTLLERSSPGSKSEFETTADFEARTNSTNPTQKQYVFVNDPAVDSHPVDRYNDGGLFTYDADQQSFSRTIKMFYVGGLFVLRSNISAKGQFVAMNAFGVRKVVNRFEKNVYELRVTQQSDVIEAENSYWYVRIRVPVKVEDAIAVKSYLKIALVCTVTESEVEHEDQIIEATIAEPREIQWHEKRLPVRIDKLWVFDSRTGHILTTLGTSSPLSP